MNVSILVCKNGECTVNIECIAGYTFASGAYKGGVCPFLTCSKPEEKTVHLLGDS